MVHLKFGYLKTLTTLTVGRREKIFVQVSKIDRLGKKLGWICDRLGDYRNHPAYCAAFSRVGSVLAVSFGQTVTFWKFDENQYIFSLPVAEKPNFAQ